jgi:hypothetical protein
VCVTHVAEAIFLPILFRAPQCLPRTSVGYDSVRLPGAVEPARKFIEDRGAVALAGSFAAELSIKQRPGADHQDDSTWTCIESRSRSSSLVGAHDRISQQRSRLIPSKRSIFSDGDQCRQPGGRSTTRGGNGKATTSQVAGSAPILRNLLRGEPRMIRNIPRRSRACEAVWIGPKRAPGRPINRPPDRARLRASPGRSTAPRRLRCWARADADRFLHYLNTNATLSWSDAQK